MKPFSIIILSFLFISITTNAQIDNDCENMLSEAENYYKSGYFIKAIGLLESCLANPNLSDRAKRQSYRLLFFIYFVKEMEVEAKEALKNLIFLDTHFHPSHSDMDPPQIQIEKIKNELLLELPQLNPKINNIIPNTVGQNEGEFTLIVNGSDFEINSVIMLNKKEIKTTYKGSTELSAEITVDDILKAGEYEITVYNPFPGGKISNAETFMVQSSSSFPWFWIIMAIAGAIIVALTSPPCC